MSTGRWGHFCATSDQLHANEVCTGVPALPLEFCGVKVKVTLVALNDTLSVISIEPESAMDVICALVSRRSYITTGPGAITLISTLLKVCPITVAAHKRGEAMSICLKTEIWHG
jgi:hypothetical protein